MSKPAPSRAPDELFAPSIPAIGEAGRDRDSAAQAGFERGETTPIFEEIASAWFRSNRPVPVTWETNGSSEGANEASAVADPLSAQPPSAQPPSAQPLAPAPADDLQSPQPPAPAPRPAPVAEPEPIAGQFSADPFTAEPIVARPVGTERQPFSEPSFAGAADEGWRAANTMESDRADELTAAGLPKRRPRARLVPGSAGSAVLASPVPASRSAENIRGRLASYQQGVRQGRETRARGESATVTDTGTNPAPADGNNDEESS